MTNPDHAVWMDVLSYMNTNHPDKCRQWFNDLQPLGTHAGVLSVRTISDVHNRYLQRNCTEPFSEALQAVSGRLLSVRFLGPDEMGEIAIAPTRIPPAPSHNGAETSTSERVEPADVLPPSARIPRPVHRASLRDTSSRSEYNDSLVINPDYTFENFVEGPENRLALAASRAVAEAPGTAYNPLFIHGGVGLGKSHLLQAICLRLLDRKPEPRIHYVSCEAFSTEFFHAVEANRMNDFRHRFRDVDVLVIDDIHFLAERERTQEEFFHTFNALYQNSRQIVLSSDAAPHEIPHLEARLVSRFLSGLVVDVKSPTYETRVQIAKRKAKIRGLDLEDDVACYIASKVTTNIREIEGAITKIQMQHLADQKPVSIELARTALDQTITELKPEVTISGIIDAVVDHYGIKLTELQSKRRQKSIARPRQVCMYLARRHTRYSLEEIGGYFGGRDHTTVMHAVRTIEAKRDQDSELDRVLGALERQLGPKN
ncbi:MAG: chromosomal replication initiator protein DnaA [Phycisphaerales bacterium]